MVKFTKENKTRGRGYLNFSMALKYREREKEEKVEGVTEFVNLAYICVHLYA